MTLSACRPERGEVILTCTRAGESGINSSETQEQDDHYQCFKTSFLFSSELASSHRQSRWSVLAPPEARVRAWVRFISSRDLR